MNDIFIESYSENSEFMFYRIFLPNVCPRGYLSLPKAEFEDSSCSFQMCLQNL